MKFLSILLVLSFFAALGCLESEYKDIPPQELILNPGMFEGKKVCIDGVIENNRISGIMIGRNESFAGDIKTGTLASVCGAYNDAIIKADFIHPILSISTGKDTYQSNETMRVHIDFTSTKEGEMQLQVSGIKNAFDRALINETRTLAIKKGANGFDFEFKTPSCEECSALAPGVYTVNATVNIGDKTLETYKKITLERES